MRQWLKDLRKQKGINQDAMAEMLGMTRQGYCMIEKGQRQKDLGLELACKIADKFHISLAKIRKYEEEVKRNGLVED